MYQSKNKILAKSLIPNTTNSIPQMVMPYGTNRAQQCAFCRAHKAQLGATVRFLQTERIDAQRKPSCAAADTDAQSCIPAFLSAPN